MSTSTLLAIALTLATVACSQRAGSGGTDALASTAAPVYPGSKVEANNVGAILVPGSGKAFSTSDSFATVYDFYKKNLPAGSEQFHVTSPKEAVVFLFGSRGDRLSVTISSSPLCCKTFIVIASA